jgi:formate dehydrogenase subunit gamma
MDGECHTDRSTVMIGLLRQALLILGAVAIVSCVDLSVPVHAQQDAVVSPDRSVQNEQTLLQQFRQLQGEIDQPIERARVLIQPVGRTWDYFHEVVLHWFGAIMIIAILAGLAAFYFIVGPLRISAGRSGRKVLRYNGFERFTHWLTATSFVVLAITGLNVTFGKLVLLPVIGPEAFSAFSQVAKYVHNFTSFPFMVGIILIPILWLKDNVPGKVDIEWFRQGGGFIQSRHAPAARFNAGEKLVFWGAIGAGLAVSISGLLLLFPFYITDIFGMQIAQVVHSIIAVLFVALILGHIYIGTLGMEGAFEAMGTGEVDYNWAKQHHDLWLQDNAKNNAEKEFEPPATAPAE